METGKIREKMGFVAGGKKVNMEEFRASAIFSGLLVLAGALMAIFPNAAANLMQWSYATWASLKWIPNATLNSWMEWLSQTSISVVSQYNLQISIALVCLGPAVLLFAVYTHETRSEQRGPTGVEN